MMEHIAQCYLVMSIKEDLKMKETKKICSICGAEINEGEGIEFEGKLLCHNCYSRHTATCECCEERFWRTDLIDGRVCHECYENHYCRCCECDSLLYEDDVYYENGYPYCRECYDDRHDAFIEDYSYKPDPIFYGNGQPHYGIELEIDCGGESDYNAEQLSDIANVRNEHVYFKHDGSLDDGFEIVSHPATLDYHLHNIAWEEIMDKARNMNYYSHTAKTCGLHIHINRAALGTTIEEQENTIGRILYFFEKFWGKILRFSRRTEGQANRWASRYGGNNINPKESLKSAKTSGLGRYTAVNLENTFTVELRIFRGTLRYKTFVATLQFVDKLCNDAVKLSDEEFQTMTWKDFTASVNDMPELKEYLKVRGLEG